MAAGHAYHLRRRGIRQRSALQKFPTTARRFRYDRPPAMRPIVVYFLGVTVGDSQVAGGLLMLVLSIYAHFGTSLHEADASPGGQVTKHWRGNGGAQP